MTKVYLVWSASGAYEDYREFLEDIFFNKEDADALLHKLQSEEARNIKEREHCQNCPITNYEPVTEDYCPHASGVVMDEDGYIFCDNEICSFDESHYWISEREVH